MTDQTPAQIRALAERLIEQLELDDEPPADVTITGSQLCSIVHCLRALADQGQRPAEDDLGLSIDMLDADRLRQWADNFDTYGSDVGHWGDRKFVAAKLRDMAARIETNVREVGVLRARRAEVAREMAEALRVGAFFNPELFGAMLKPSDNPILRWHDLLIGATSAPTGAPTGEPEVVERTKPSEIVARHYRDPAWLADYFQGLADEFRRLKESPHAK